MRTESLTGVAAGAKTTVGYTPIITFRIYQGKTRGNHLRHVDLQVECRVTVKKCTSEETVLSGTGGSAHLERQNQAT